MGRHSVTVQSARSAVVLIAPTLVMVACYTTLEPTHLEPAQCSSVDLGASRYAVCTDPLVYARAAEDCRLRGAHLAALNSAEEDTALAAAAFAIVESSNVWVGGTRTEDLVWSWPDGSVFWRGGRDGEAEAGAFVLWQDGEPNNSSSTTSEPEACLALTVQNADWNDRSCSISLPYLCETELTDGD